MSKLFMPKLHVKDHFFHFKFHLDVQRQYNKNIMGYMKMTYITLANFEKVLISDNFVYFLIISTWIYVNICFYI